MKKYLFLLFAVFVFQLHAAEKSEEQNIEVGTLDVTTDHSSGEWITVKTIDIATQPQNDGCGFLCTSVPPLEFAWLSYGSGYVDWSLNEVEQTVSTTDGNMMVRLSYSDVKIKEILGMTVEETYLEYQQEVDSSASDPERRINTKSACPLVGGRCVLSLKAGLVSGKIDIQVKLPPALSKKEYVFGNVQVGNIKVQSGFDKNPGYINTYSSTANKKVTLSGTISVPDRCYLLIDNTQQTDSSTQNIIFNDVDADKVTAGKTPLSSKTLQLRSQCVGVKGGSKSVNLDVKLTASDMGVENGYVFKLKPKNDTGTTAASRYLGIVARLLSTVSCNDSDSNALKNGVYKYTGTVVQTGSNIYQSGMKSVPLTFSLCSFGDSGNLLTGGEHTGALKLTARWKFE